MPYALKTNNFNFKKLNDNDYQLTDVLLDNSITQLKEQCIAKIESATAQGEEALRNYFNTLETENQWVSAIPEAIQNIQTQYDGLDTKYNTLKNKFDNTDVNQLLTSDIDLTQQEPMYGFVQSVSNGWTWQKKKDEKNSDNTKDIFYIDKANTRPWVCYDYKQPVAATIKLQITLPQESESVTINENTLLKDINSTITFKPIQEYSLPDNDNNNTIEIDCICTTAGEIGNNISNVRFEDDALSAITCVAVAPSAGGWDKKEYYYANKNFTCIVLSKFIPLEMNDEITIYNQEEFKDISDNITCAVIKFSPTDESSTIDSLIRGNEAYEKISFATNTDCTILDSSFRTRWAEANAPLVVSISAGGKFSFRVNTNAKHLAFIYSYETGAYIEYDSNDTIIYSYKNSNDNIVNTTLYRITTQSRPFNAKILFNNSEVTLAKEQRPLFSTLYEQWLKEQYLQVVHPWWRLHAQLNFNSNNNLNDFQLDAKLNSSESNYIASSSLIYTNGQSQQLHIFNPFSKTIELTIYNFNTETPDSASPWVKHIYCPSSSTDGVDGIPYRTNLKIPAKETYNYYTEPNLHYYRLVLSIPKTAITTELTQEQVDTMILIIPNTATNAYHYLMKKDTLLNNIGSQIETLQASVKNMQLVEQKEFMALSNDMNLWDYDSNKIYTISLRDSSDLTQLAQLQENQYFLQAIATYPYQLNINYSIYEVKSKQVILRKYLIDNNSIIIPPNTPFTLSVTHVNHQEDLKTEKNFLDMFNHIHFVKLTTPPIRWCALGDSITEGLRSFDTVQTSENDDGSIEYSWSTSNGNAMKNQRKNWVSLIADTKGWFLDNQGVGSTGWLDQSSGKLNALSIIDTLSSENNTYFKNFDIVTLAWGINDYKGTSFTKENNIPTITGSSYLGELSDLEAYDPADTEAPVDSIIRAMMRIIYLILKQNPAIKIYVLLPLNCAITRAAFTGKANDDETDVSDRIPLLTATQNYCMNIQNTVKKGNNNEPGYTLLELHDTMIKVCNALGVEYIDLTLQGPVNRYNLPELLKDGVHPTTTGHALLAKEIASKLWL